MNNKFFIGSAVGSFQNLGKAQPVSKVVVQVDEDHAYEAGNDSGYILTVYNPYGTQQMANDLLQQAQGFVYQGVKADNIELPPTAELGDGITVGGVYSLLSNRTINFSPKFVSDVHTPWSPEIEHRYKYEGTYQRELRKRVQLGQSYFGTRITRQKGLEIVKVAADGTETSMAQLNSEKLAFYDANGNEALYFDASTGKYKFVGDVVITGGSLNINQNFIVDTLGNLTLRGNIDMSNGVITWGENVPKGEKGDKGDKGDTGATGPQGPPGEDAYVPSYIEVNKITQTTIESPTITGNTIRALKDFSVGLLSGSRFTPYGHFGLAHGRDAENNKTYGVALACAGMMSLSDGIISYETKGQYVIVTGAGVRMQAENNNITVTKNGTYLTARDGDDNVIYRLALMSSGLYLDEGSTRLRILTEGDTVTAVWG